FNQMRLAIADLSAESSYTEQIDSIAEAIRLGQTSDALTELDNLKLDINGFIAAVSRLLNRTLESDLNRTMETVVLRRRVIEGARAFASLNEDPAGVKLMNHQLENDSAEL